MKFKRKLMSVLLSAVMIAGSFAAPVMPAAAEGSSLLPAFPGAEGAGKYATGGRGGTVRHVTNLNSSGEGSFREAASHSNSIIVFDVGGTIDLKNKDLVVSGNVTVAGQTAPGGKGITVRNGKIGMGGDNIIIRFVSSRPGEKGTESDYDAWGGSKGSNSIIDHCSIGFANDEQFGLYSSNMHQTVQYTIIGPSNCVSYHSKGAHGFGAMFGKGQNSWHHNLLCHSLSRNFRGKVEKGSEPMDFTNNVIYDWGYQTAYGTLGHINYANNYLKAGPSTKKGYRFLNNSSGSSRENYRFYITGNTMRKKDDSYYNKDIENNNQWLGVEGFNESVYRASEPFKVPAVNGEDATTLSGMDTAEEGYKKVVRYSGAGVHPADNTASGYNYENDTTRPLIDARVLYETYTGTGSLTGARDFSTVKDGSVNSAIKTYGIQHINYDDYYPAKSTEQPPADSDNDGMPDEWENARGLNPSKNDSKDDYLGQGYTNIEYYLNDLTVDAFPPGVVTESEPVGNYAGYADARADADAIKLTDALVVKPEDLPLPTVGAKKGSVITWASASDAIEITDNKVTAVNRPEGDNEAVSLMAEIFNTDYTMKKYFTVTVKSTTTRWIASESDSGKGPGDSLMEGLYPLETMTGKKVDSYSVNGTDLSGTYGYYIAGGANGTWDKTAGTASGSGFKYTPVEDGYVTMYISSLGTAPSDTNPSGSEKHAYIVEEGAKTQEDDCLADISAVGENAMLTAPVKAGHTYYLYVAGSKGRYVGVTFGRTGAVNMWMAKTSAALGGTLMKGLTVNDDMTYTAKKNPLSIGGVDGFTGYISNPEHNSSPDGKSGSSMTYTPDMDGIITVYYKVNSGKTFKINDENGNTIAAYTNEPPIEPGETPNPNADYPSEYTSTSAELRGGATYYIFTAGSKGEYYGAAFEPAEIGEPPEATASPAPSNAPAPSGTESPKPTNGPEFKFIQGGEKVESFTDGEVTFAVSGLDDPCSIIIAGYDEDGALIGANIEEYDPASGEASAALTAAADTAEIRGFIWSGTENIKPVSSVYNKINRK